jgi:hypothetical protein
VTEEGHGQNRLTPLAYPPQKEKGAVTGDEWVVEGEKNEEVSSGTVVIRVHQVVCLQNGLRKWVYKQFAHSEKESLH